MKFSCFPFIFLVILSGCAVSPSSMRQQQADFAIPIEQEISLGEQSCIQVLQRLGGIYPDEPLNEFVDRVGQRVAAQEGRSGLVFHFSVANDSIPNVFALPGGYVVITRGLLLTLENEAQLAAILAHGIAHINSQHSSQEVEHYVRLSTPLGENSLSETSGYVQSLDLFSQLTSELLDKIYTCEQEYAADLLSVDYLAGAGYSLQGALDLQHVFSDKLKRHDSSKDAVGFFRSHPLSCDHLTPIKNHIATAYSEKLSSNGLQSSNYKKQIVTLQKTHKAYDLYDQARILESQNKSGEAIVLYHKAMQQAPDQGLLLTALGMAYLRNDDLIPAKRYLRKAVAIDPQYYQSRMGLGYLELQNRQFEEASQQLQLSATLLPTVEGIFLLAQAEEAQGHIPRAKQLYQIVIDTDAASRIGQAAAEQMKSL
jgi:predicted Zn-dependent protease